MVSKMNYYELLVEKEKLYGNTLFLKIDTLKITYTRGLQLVDEVAKVLSGTFIEESMQEKVIKKVVLIQGENLLFEVLAFFALQKLGCIPIIGQEKMPQNAVKELMQVNHINYLLQGKAELLRESYNGDFNIKAFINDKEAAKDKSINEMQQKACMGVLSSGSTGAPKVLYRSYESWADFFAVQNKHFLIKEQTPVFFNGYLAFTGNLNTFLGTLYAGGSLVTIVNLNPRQWVQSIIEDHIAVIYLVPTKLKLLTKVMKQSVHSLQCIFTGSQLVGASLYEKLRLRFPKADIVLYYGATELNYITYLKNEEIKSEPLSVGKPFEGIHVTVQAHKIYVDTQYSVLGLTMPYTLGDMGYFNQSGYLIFEGREGDMINKGGFKISSTKVERALRQIQEVEEAVVLPYEDACKGYEIAAFLVLNKKLSKEEIRKTLRANLGDLEIPKKIIFVAQIPLKSSGKVDRRKLWALVREKNSLNIV